MTSFLKWHMYALEWMGEWARSLHFPANIIVRVEGRKRKNTGDVFIKYILEMFFLQFYSEKENKFFKNTVLTANLPFPMRL